MTERPVAVVTGTSRDLGKYTAIALGQSGHDILGLYRNPDHDDDQKAVIQEVKSNKGPRMVAIRADLLNEGTPGLMVAELREKFGRRANALIVSTAGGYGGSLEVAREINVFAQSRLMDAFVGNITEGGVVVYNTSYPAHRFGIMTDSQKQLLGDYASVAQSHWEGEQLFRSRIPELAERDIRLAIVVGNGLEGTFVTRALKRSNREFTEQMRLLSEEGFLPTAMEMAVADVKMVRGNFPTGHTEYVGIAPEHQLYPSRPLGLSLVGAPEMSSGSILSREEIYNIIPHRWPFMFIGGVDEIAYGKRATGTLVDLKHPDINWRGGHFPSYPLVPGAITQEALSQLGALVVLGMSEYRGMTALLTEVEMRFLRQLLPGDNVKLEAEDMDIVEAGRKITGNGHVRAFNTAGKLAVEGDIAFALIKPVISVNVS